MDSTAGAKANLKKYINLNGKWRFVPVVKHESRASAKHYADQD